MQSVVAEQITRADFFDHVTDHIGHGTPDFCGVGRVPLGQGRWVGLMD